MEDTSYSRDPHSHLFVNFQGGVKTSVEIAATTAPEVHPFYQACPVSDSNRCWVSSLRKGVPLLPSTLAPPDSTPQHSLKQEGLWGSDTTQNYKVFIHPFTLSFIHPFIHSVTIYYAFSDHLLKILHKTSTVTQALPSASLHSW